MFAECLLRFSLVQKGKLTTGYGVAVVQFAAAYNSLIEWLDDRCCVWWQEGDLDVLEFNFVLHFMTSSIVTKQDDLPLFVLELLVKVFQNCRPDCAGHPGFGVAIVWQRQLFHVLKATRIFDCRHGRVVIHCVCVCVRLCGCGRVDAGTTVYGRIKEWGMKTPNLHPRTHTYHSQASTPCAHVSALFERQQRKVNKTISCAFHYAGLFSELKWNGASKMPK